MPIVVDSSVAASWGMPDEVFSLSMALLSVAGREGICVPSAFWHEMRNVFLVSERRGRLQVYETTLALSLVDKLAPMIDETNDHDAVLAFARRHRLSAYDAAYLELALRMGAALATQDRRLAAAAEAEGVTLLA